MICRNCQTPIFQEPTSGHWYDDELHFYCIPYSVMHQPPALDDVKRQLVKAFLS